MELRDLEPLSFLVGVDTPFIITKYFVYGNRVSTNVLNVKI